MGHGSRRRRHTALLLKYLARSPGLYGGHVAESGGDYWAQCAPPPPRYHGFRFQPQLYGVVLRRGHGGRRTQTHTSGGRLLPLRPRPLREQHLGLRRHLPRPLPGRGLRRHAGVPADQARAGVAERPLLAAGLGGAGRPLFGGGGTGAARSTAPRRQRHRRRRRHRSVGDGGRRRRLRHLERCTLLVDNEWNTKKKCWDNECKKWKTGWITRKGGNQLSLEDKDHPRHAY